MAEMIAARMLDVQTGALLWSGALSTVPIAGSRCLLPSGNLWRHGTVVRVTHTMPIPERQIPEEVTIHARLG